MKYMYPSRFPGDDQLLRGASVRGYKNPQVVELITSPCSILSPFNQLIVHHACNNPSGRLQDCAHTRDVRRPNSDGFETASMGSAAHRETAAKCEPPHTWDMNDGIKAGGRRIDLFVPSSRLASNNKDKLCEDSAQNHEVRS